MSEWRTYLKKLCLNHNFGAFCYNNKEMNELNIMKITEEFQTVYPGKYNLDWKVNTTTWTMELAPIFENEKDSNWWYLKNG